jgi:hypothetical protein
MYGSGIRIKKATNGWVVCYEDPKIIAENRKPGSRYRDADKEVIFTNESKLVAFIKNALPKLMPISNDEEFADEFAKRTTD